MPAAAPTAKEQTQPPGYTPHEIRLHQAAYSDEFTRVRKLAGLPKIRLHDSRHTTLSLLDKPLQAAGPPLALEMAALTC